MRTGQQILRLALAWGPSITDGNNTYLVALALKCHF